MRQVILIQDLEIRDKLASSNINKFLYLYSSEAMPKQQDANMVNKVDGFFFQNIIQIKMFTVCCQSCPYTT